MSRFFSYVYLYPLLKSNQYNIKMLYNEYQKKNKKNDNQDNNKIIDYSSFNIIKYILPLSFDNNENKNIKSFKYSNMHYLCFLI